MPVSEAILGDCMQHLQEFEDKYFDLAIVDPPYGISQPAFRPKNRGKKAFSKKYNHAVYKQSAPGPEYFYQLFRVSKNQIIWGAQFMIDYLKPGTQWIFWDKKTEKAQWGDGELAYTSFPGAVAKFTYAWNGFIQGNMQEREMRIHPTQKPVALYRWLLTQYAKPGNKILDTHMGSQSSRIAAHQMGFEYCGFEINEQYYNEGCKRFEELTAQLKLF